MILFYAPLATERCPSKGPKKLNRSFFFLVGPNA